ncbi:MAG: hypothetical protein ACSLEY_03475, partial [Candidatus Saccharimonadales bacterium]
MMAQKISQMGELLQQLTDNITAHDTYRVTHKKGETLHVPNVANAVLHAYEQLRNVSENIEDHLLLQRAILRFYKRTLSLPDPSSKGLAQELIIELTQAEYLENNTVPLSQIKEIEAIIDRYHASYQSADATDRRSLERWLFELLAVETEQILSNPVRIISFARFAHAHLSQVIDYSRILKGDMSVTRKDYSTILYIAIHKALLKSDDANIRSELLELHGISPAQTKEFISFNQTYDSLIASSATIKLTRFVSKNGAPLHIVRAAFFDENKEQVTNVDITKQTQMINVVETCIDHEYKEVRRRVNHGVIRSVIFLFITKTLVGLFIEVPYDIAIYGTIIPLPLIVNLLFPPIFLALTAFTFRIPGEANKRALTNYIEGLLYEKDNTKPALRYSETIDNRTAF